jgi:hypothetical protein
VAFFGLHGQDPCRLIAWKPCVLVKGSVKGRDNRRLLGGFLVVHFARLGRTELDHCAGYRIDQQDVLVGMRLLFAAGVLLLRGVILGALAAALCPINRPIGGALQGEVVGSDLARIAFWGQAETGSGAL